eukprot:TRINITY_DN11492_c3_g1_i2.p3 TRINITY_DN11492_c3_g1~~TRINITY_DN11492_c3_g1_i2.p3  ORF type:complete len:113 (+),score=12.30 TRINITY_DN11492_c3_g1_i2:461-799(+)
MVHFGFSPDQAGLEAFTQQLQTHRTSDSSQEISAGIRETWATVLAGAFDVDTSSQQLLTVEQARELTSMLASRMQSEEFNKQVDERMVGYRSLWLCSIVICRGHCFNYVGLL